MPADSPAPALSSARLAEFYASGLSVTAGYEFDVPVRFDSDKLEVNMTGFNHGAIPNIPIVEVRL